MVEVNNGPRHTQRPGDRRQQLLELADSAGSGLDFPIVVYREESTNPAPRAPQHRPA